MKGNNRFYEALLFSVLFLVLCWIFFISEEYLSVPLRQYGLIPRDPKGLIGIVSMHFLHGDLKHILNNSLSFIVLNTMLYYFYREIAHKTFFSIFVVGAILLWIWGRGNNHIGASLIIFGEAAFLFFSGIFRNHPLLIRVGLVVAFFYGSMVWWLFPIDPQISWEGHLSGAVVGLAVAWLWRKQGPQRPKQRFELEEEQEEAWRQLADEDIEVRDVQEYRLPRDYSQIDHT